MIAVIRDFYDFHVRATAAVVSGSLMLESVALDGCSVTLAGHAVGHGDVGHWLVIDTQVWYIDSVAPSEAVVDVDLLDPIDAFADVLKWDRNVLISSMESMTIVSLSLMHYYHGLASDPAYDLLYLQAYHEERTGKRIGVPELNDAGLFSLPAYLRTISRLTFERLTWTASGEYLRAYSAMPTGQRYNISLTGYSAQLISLEYGADQPAKVTAYYGTSKTALHRCRRPDGTWSDGLAGDRVRGSRIVLPDLYDTKALASDAIDLTIEQYASPLHKLVFQSRARYHIGDGISCHIYGETLDTTIESVSRSVNSDTYTYTCGALRDLYTDRQNSAQAAKVASTN